MPIFRVLVHFVIPAFTLLCLANLIKINEYSNQLELEIVICLLCFIIFMKSMLTMNTV